MTVEQMANRLGIDEVELEVLRAQEQAKSLPGRYCLRDYLGTQVLEKQNQEWMELIRMLTDARARASQTFEEVDDLQAKLRIFIRTL